MAGTVTWADGCSVRPAGRDGGKTDLGHIYILDIGLGAMGMALDTGDRYWQLLDTHSAAIRIE